MNRIIVLTPLVNMVGAVAIYFYFSFIQPTHETAAEIPGYFSPVFAAMGTAVLCLFGILFFRRSLKSMFDVAFNKIPIHSLEESEIYHLQRETLKFPMVVALISFMIWICWPLS